MIKTYANYLEKRAAYAAFIEEPVLADLGMVIVIPSYHEKELMATLQSLQKCTSTESGVEVIIVLNDRETDDPQLMDYHHNQLNELKLWSKIHSTEKLRFLPIYATQLPKKKAGVGLARKLGMDEAVRRFLAVERSGLIVALDADTLVEANYLQAIEAHFQNHSKCPGASIAYAHRLEGLAAKQRRAIVQYELHLRLFLAMKRWTGFPFAYETIGSAMVVRAAEYCQQGGMNTRKAGEDFYFLNKFIPLGHFAEIKETKVLPSARISERVPFGTGRAMQSILGNGEEWKTYDPKLFVPLKTFFARIDDWRDGVKWEGIEENLLTYLQQEQVEKVIEEIGKNTSSIDAFRKRFFRWFDAFRLMKYLHFCLEKGGEKVSVLEAGRWILGDGWEIMVDEVMEEERMLEKFRGV